MLILLTPVVSRQLIAHAYTRLFLECMVRKTKASNAILLFLSFVLFWAIESP